MLHPYILAEPTAVASLDSLRAMENLIEAREPDLSLNKDKTIFWGASEGGYAALISDRYRPHYLPDFNGAATVAAIPDSHFAGQVSAINTSVNPQTRTVRIRATLGNEDNQLRPGMFATVATRQPQDREVVTVPRTAVSYNTYGDFVFVVEENDDGELVVNRRTIQTGNTRDSRVAVLDGLKEGEQVVSKGLLRLRAGQRVEVQEDEQPAEASK